MTSHRPDPLVTHTRREAIFAVALWLAATVYTVGYCAAYGYERPVSELTFVLGIPSWVFWGIVAPWTACTVISICFAARFMCDDPLGDEAVADAIGAETSSEQSTSTPEPRDA